MGRVRTAMATAAGATMACLLLGACASGSETTTGSTASTSGADGTSTANGGAGGGQAGNAQGTGTTAPPGTSVPATSGPVTATVATVTPTTARATVPEVLPEASNCSPGPGALPDGVYFGYGTEALDDVLLFDLACWFTGQAAIEAATADGVESPPPNDYHIRNSNATERQLYVSTPDLPVLRLPDNGGPDTVATTYTEWVSLRSSDGYLPPLWVAIEGGELTAIVEQYLP